MSVPTTETIAETTHESRTGLPLRRSRRRGMRPGVSLLAQGEPMVWLTGGALAMCLLMIGGLLLLVLMAGMSTFWPRSLVLFPLKNGSHYLGEVSRRRLHPFQRHVGLLGQALSRCGPGPVEW